MNSKFLATLFLSMAVIPCRTGCTIEISQEQLLTRVFQQLYVDLPNKTDVQLIDYINELEIFIPQYTNHTWPALRTPLLEAVDKKIAHHKKYIGYPVDPEMIRLGTGLLSVGTLAGIGAYGINMFVCGPLRIEKKLLKEQYTIRERVEYVSENRKIIHLSSKSGRPYDECNAALTRYNELYKDPMGLYAIPFFISSMTAFVTLYAGILVTINGFLNPHHKECFEKLCLFKQLLNQIDQPDRSKYQTPLIVNASFFQERN